MQNNIFKIFVIPVLRTAIKILPGIFWLLLIFGFDSPLAAILTILCAVIHEGGHIVAFWTISATSDLGNSFSGFQLKPKRLLSYKEELAVSAAGPAINLILAVLCFAFRNSLSGYVGLFGVFNLLTAISNLLPINGYDGYRILYSILHLAGISEAPERLLNKISITVTVTLCFLSLYLILVSNSGYWIYFILLAGLMRSIGSADRLFTRKQEKTRAFERKQEFL